MFCTFISAGLFLFCVGNFLEFLLILHLLLQPFPFLCESELSCQSRKLKPLSLPQIQKNIYLFFVFMKLLYVITINHVGYKRRQLPQGSGRVTRSCLVMLDYRHTFSASPQMSVLLRLVKQFNSLREGPQYQRTEKAGKELCYYIMLYVILSGR